MKRLLVALLLAAPFVASAGGGAYSVPVGTNLLVVAPVIDGYRLKSEMPRSNSVVYAVGSVVRMLDNQAYVAQIGGTSGTNVLALGPEIVVDGTVTWLRESMMERTVVLLQLVSGACTVTIADAPLVLSTAGMCVGLAAPSCYQGPVYVNAAVTNTTINVVTF